MVDLKAFLKKLEIKSYIFKKDMLYFALPGLIVWIIEVGFLANDGLSNFWTTLWNLIIHPQHFSLLSSQSMIGLALFVIGLSIMIFGQITLWRFYSSFLVIKKDHQLITHGIYRFTRNPIYLGAIMIFIGLPVYVGSIRGFICSLVLIFIIRIRIWLEEKLLSDEFQDSYEKYKKTTKRLIPFIY